MSIDQQGMILLVLALGFSMMSIWRRQALFILSAGGFWMAFLAFVIAQFTDGAMKQIIVSSLAAVVGGLALYGLRVDGNGSNGFQRFLSRLNNDKYETPRSGRETAEEYRDRAHRALHPNRIKK